MELKQAIQDYTEHEFLNFIKKIWSVDVSEHEHDKLVSHFDTICQHPMGADLLFYMDDFDEESSPENVLATLKGFRAYKKLPGFKEQQPGEIPPETENSKAFVDTPGVYYVPFSRAAEGPVVMTVAAGAMASFESILQALQEATLNAVARFSRLATTQGSHVIGKYVDILSFHMKLGYSERYALSVPLSELGFNEPVDWQSVAEAKGEVSLPFRLGSGKAFELGDMMSAVHLATTDGKLIESSVKVRRAVSASHTGTYKFTSEDDAAITLIWISERRPLDTSKRYRSTIISRSIPAIQTFANPSDVKFDDYVVVFPPNSGSAPLYVMFQNNPG
ncbi:bacteriocin immunity protein [Pseudomonas sp. Leaf48]|jgi:hypothetical protein|uniref:bacteriocin immunity protein n=1 Tax=Pseudomonas sp. Leaf48 TaxID=1736221 RepID=UPI000A5A2DA9|nr:bacteriocin immunity protein [Pseudomonas sp. Leaf48]